MAMPWMLHGVTLDELKLVVYLDLIESVKCIVITLVVSSSYQVELLRQWALNTLEIVREAAVVVWLDLDGLNSLLSQVQLVNVLRVFLKEVNYLNCRSVVLVSAHVKHWL